MGLFSRFTLPSVKPSEAMDMLSAGATMLDVRDNSEWNAGQVPWAVHVPRPLQVVAGSQKVEQELTGYQLGAQEAQRMPPVSLGSYWTLDKSRDKCRENSPPSAAGAVRARSAHTTWGGSRR